MKTFKGLMLEGSKEGYKKFFDKKLAKYKVDSPEDLSDEEKKKFFNEIDKEWKGDDEKAEGFVKEFINKDGTRRRCDGGDGRKSKKVKKEGDCPDEDEDEMEEAKAQEAWEASLSFESAQSDAVVSITVTEHTDKRGAKKMLYQAMQDIASDMSQFVKMNKSDIKYKKVQG
tara:strand:+ start:85 stop:597 length:513 start_codon:yes stop_codon:yes gene_type:complete